ncbi:hypothetical protein FA951_05045 [Dermacoccus nishinomiyaensis]|uniref:hypothetical protein n=1 Tax=Dermacoccus TaxID=57495 RepID=UPI0010AD9171|nr:MULTISPECIES: hypothetical protein [Dermacoccus]TJZ97186.1 hypothetical protein FA951_05045 [Dermacoccus nishinomiyaensis]
MTTTISPASAATMFVLLEGPSDVAAVAALMERDGLASPNVELVNLQGATNVGRVLGEIRQIRSDADVVGLCDAADTRASEKALADDGLPVLDASDLPVYGFFVCEPDLEGELIRALGAERAKAAIEGAGLGSKFDALRTQAAWADEPLADQLRRFARAVSGRKENAAAVLAAALGADEVPEPLAMLLDRIRYA